MPTAMLTALRHWSELEVKRRGLAHVVGETAPPRFPAPPVRGREDFLNLSESGSSINHARRTGVLPDLSIIGRGNRRRSTWRLLTVLRVRESSFLERREEC